MYVIPFCDEYCHKDFKEKVSPRGPVNFKVIKSKAFRSKRNRILVIKYTGFFMLIGDKTCF